MPRYFPLPSLMIKSGRYQRKEPLEKQQKMKITMASKEEITFHAYVAAFMWVWERSLKEVSDDQ